MRTEYKEKQIWYVIESYEDLVSRPLIESVLLEGNHNIDWYNMYDKDTIINLVTNASKIKIVPTKPTTPKKNTLYYVGTDNIFDLYYYTPTLREFYLGRTSFTTCIGSEGIDVTEDNNIKLILDNGTLYVNQNNVLSADVRLYTAQGLHLRTDGVLDVVTDTDPENVLHIDTATNKLQLDVMEGATQTTPGRHGIIPAPQPGDNEKYLTGDCTYKDFASMGLIGEIKPFIYLPDQSTGWILCDGRSLSAASYPELYAKIGNLYGGNGTTFNVPDCVGRCLEGYGPLAVRTMMTTPHYGAPKPITITSADHNLGDYIDQGMPAPHGEVALVRGGLDPDNTTGVFAHESRGNVVVPSQPGPTNYRYNVWRTAFDEHTLSSDHGNSIWDKNATRMQIKSVKFYYCIRAK